jgi:hypothetical protein
MGLSAKLDFSLVRGRLMEHQCSNNLDHKDKHIRFERLRQLIRVQLAKDRGRDADCVPPMSEVLAERCLRSDCHLTAIHLLPKFLSFCRTIKITLRTFIHTHALHL